MREFALVATREYLENLRTKTFWIGILIFPVVLALVVTVPRLLAEAKDERPYAVLDHSGWLLEAVEGRLRGPSWRLLLSDALRDATGETAEDDSHAPLPAELRSLGAELAAVPEPERSDRVRDVVAKIELLEVLPSKKDELPPAVRPIVEKALEDRGSILDWFHALPSEQAERWRLASDEQRFRRIEAPAADEAELKRMLEDQEIFAYFVVPADVLDPEAESVYVSDNHTDDELRRWFAAHASEVVRERRMSEQRIAPEVVEAIIAPVDFRRRQIGLGGGVTEISNAEVARDYAPIAFVYMLWIAIFAIAQMLLTNTIEEKSNRIIEVLLSSISPLELMSGKIAGIAATGLTIVASWILVLFVGIRFALPALDMDPGFDLSFILRDPVYLISFAAYFLLGYLFFAALLVGIGAVCNSLKEAQNLMTPVTVVLMLPLLSMFPVVQDPNGTLARVLSFVPPMTPFIMMNRAAGPPSTSEYVLTTLLLLVSIAALFWAAAKIFRVGVLMTGKPPRLREILRWLRSPAADIETRP